jgi:hypothetical protein
MKREYTGVRGDITLRKKSKAEAKRVLRDRVNSAKRKTVGAQRAPLI